MLAPLLLFSLMILEIGDSTFCYNTNVRLYCGDRPYYGTLIVALWDDDYLYDTNIITSEVQVKAAQLVHIIDDRHDCWGYDPYIIFSSLCEKPPKEQGFVEGWVEYFEESFADPLAVPFPYFNTCRIIPSSNGNAVTVQLLDDDC